MNVLVNLEKSLKLILVLKLSFTAYLTTLRIIGRKESNFSFPDRNKRRLIFPKLYIRFTAGTTQVGKMSNLSIEIVPS